LINEVGVVVMKGFDVKDINIIAQGNKEKFRNDRNCVWQSQIANEICSRKCTSER